MAKIIETNTSKFLSKNIIRRFDIPRLILLDNERQFDNKMIRNLCDELVIEKHFSFPHHPQVNGQGEDVNKTIEYTLKRKLYVEMVFRVLKLLLTICNIPNGTIKE